MKKVLMVLMAAALIAGCANKEGRIAKREARLAKETAFALGVDTSAVQISNVSGNMYGYRWSANVGGANYNCSLLGGNFATWGQSVVPATCNPVSGKALPAKKGKKAKSRK